METAIPLSQCIRITVHLLAISLGLFSPALFKFLIKKTPFNLL